ncbi:hypothetical protein HDU88_001042 [Geranomyces variabilis]|nr:hypothetical protein HDU88_001042 [Geranomyces variabilis]
MPSCSLDPLLSTATELGFFQNDNNQPQPPHSSQLSSPSAPSLVSLLRATDAAHRDIHAANHKHHLAALARTDADFMLATPTAPLTALRDHFDQLDSGRVELARRARDHTLRPGAGGAGAGGAGAGGAGAGATAVERTVDVELHAQRPFAELIESMQTAIPQADARCADVDFVVSGGLQRELLAQKPALQRMHDRTKELEDILLTARRPVIS